MEDLFRLMNIFWPENPIIEGNNVDPEEDEIKRRIKRTPSMNIVVIYGLIGLSSGEIWVNDTNNISSVFAMFSLITSVFSFIYVSIGDQRCSPIFLNLGSAELILSIITLIISLIGSKAKKFSVIYILFAGFFICALINAYLKIVKSKKITFLTSNGNECNQIYSNLIEKEKKATTSNYIIKKFIRIVISDKYKYKIFFLSTFDFQLQILIVYLKIISRIDDILINIVTGWIMYIFTILFFLSIYSFYLSQIFIKKEIYIHNSAVAFIFLVFVLMFQLYIYIHDIITLYPFNDFEMIVNSVLGALCCLSSIGFHSYVIRLFYQLKNDDST